MKKIFICGAIVFSSLSPLCAQAQTKSPEITSQEIKAKNAEEANIYLSRLNEIQEMDKSDLNPMEKSELRQEVKTIRKKLLILDGGIYISVGAIIIILLIILILV